MDVDVLMENLDLLKMRSLLPQEIRETSGNPEANPSSF